MIKASFNLLTTFNLFTVNSIDDGMVTPNSEILEDKLGIFLIVGQVHSSMFEEEVIRIDVTWR